MVRRGCPTSEKEKFEGGDDFTILSKVFLVDLGAALKHCAARRAAQAGVEGVGLAEAAKVVHQVISVFVAGSDRDAIGHGQGKAGALEQRAQIANFAHGGDARGKATCDLALRLGKACA